MNARRLFAGFCLSVLCLAAPSSAFGLANRVFVSARSGNNAKQSGVLENDFDGLAGQSTNAQSAVRYSNCVFANNGRYGVARLAAGPFETRGNNTITGNGSAPTSGTIDPFLPM